jgi:hypothetical protein
VNISNRRVTAFRAQHHSGFIMPESLVVELRLDRPRRGVCRLRARENETSIMAQAAHSE